MKVDLEVHQAIYFSEDRLRKVTYGLIEQFKDWIDGAVKVSDEYGGI